MEQWKLPELRYSGGYQLQVPGGNSFQERSGLSPTPAPTPANSTRNGNGISTHNHTTAAIFKPWSYYTLDCVKKRHKDIERTLNTSLVDTERHNNRYAERIEELKQCHKYLTSLKELKIKLNEAYERQDRLVEELDNWKDLVESLEYKGAEAEADMASEDSEFCSEEEFEEELDEESEDEDERESEKEGGEEDEV